MVIAKEVEYSKYIKVKAQIIDIYNEKARTSSGKHIIKYEFKVDEKTYNPSKQVLFTLGYFFRSSEIIRYNPKNPEEIENTSLVNTGIFMAAFFGIICSLLILTVYQNR